MCQTYIPLQRQTSRVGACAGHVHFMLFTSCSLTLGTQCKPSFQWNTGLKNKRGKTCFSDTFFRDHILQYGLCHLAEKNITFLKNSESHQRKRKMALHDCCLSLNHLKKKKNDQIQAQCLATSVNPFRLQNLTIPKCHFLSKNSSISFPNLGKHRSLGINFLGTDVWATTSRKTGF